jgi:hypothetical protein
MITLTNFEKAELARFAQFIRRDEPLKAECELLAALPAGSRVACQAFDRCMSAYRAWLVFGTLPIAA